MARLDEALRFHCERRGFSMDTALYIGTGNPLNFIAKLNVTKPEGK